MSRIRESIDEANRARRAYAWQCFWWRVQAILSMWWFWLLCALLFYGICWEANRRAMLYRAAEIILERSGQ